MRCKAMLIFRVTRLTDKYQPGKRRPDEATDGEYCWVHAQKHRQELPRTIVVPIVGDVG